MSKLIWGRSPVTLFYILAGRPYSRTPSLPARQLGDLNEVAARVVQLGDGRAGYLGRRFGELGAARFDPLIVALDVVGKKHDRGLVLLKYGLLVGLGRRVVIERELQLGSVRLVGRGHGQPAIWPVAEIGLLREAEHFGVEAQSLFLVIHIHAGQLDLHWSSS